MKKYLLWFSFGVLLLLLIAAGTPTLYVPWTAFRGTNGTIITTNPATGIVLIQGAYIASDSGFGTNITLDGLEIIGGSSIGVQHDGDSDIGFAGAGYFANAYLSNIVAKKIFTSGPQTNASTLDVNGNVTIWTGGTLISKNGADISGDTLTANSGLTVTSGGLQVNAGNINLGGAGAFQGNGLGITNLATSLTNSSKFGLSDANGYGLRTLSSGNSIQITNNGTNLIIASTGGGIAPTNVAYVTTNLLIDANYGSTNWPTVFRTQLTNNFGLSITNGSDGQEIIFEAYQDATGNRTGVLVNLTGGSSTNMITVGTDITGMGLSTNATTLDILKFKYVVSFGGKTNRWNLIGNLRGY